MIAKIISGGQTGVDRAALDVALALNIPCGGWCPKGRKAEDGIIAVNYPLDETPSSDYAQRTEWNVRDSDGTLIILRGAPGGGTKLTIELAEQYHKPLYQLELASPDIFAVKRWVLENRIARLNVAGPRESQSPGMYAAAKKVLQELLRSY